MHSNVQLTTVQCSLFVIREVSYDVRACKQVLLIRYDLSDL